MRASQKLIDHIKHSEACALQAYQDSAKVWTIGFGHTRGVKRGDRCTQFQAEQWLKEDLAKFEATANRVKRIVTQGQYDAVLDFIYNCGPGNFEKSTLKQYIESVRKTYEIQQQFMRWVNAGGKFQGGLYSRRIWEAARWAE
jgi:lysozyme